MTKDTKKPTSFTMSDTAQALLAKIGNHHGLSSKSGVVEMLIRAEARRLNLE